MTMTRVLWPIGQMAMLNQDPCEVLMPLLLRRTQGHHPADRGPHHYDVLDGDSVVGRIYLVDKFQHDEAWFWGLGFEAQLDRTLRRLWAG